MSCQAKLTALRQGPQLQHTVQPSPQEPRQRGHTQQPLASACRCESSKQVGAQWDHCMKAKKQRGHTQQLLASACRCDCVAATEL